MIKYPKINDPIEPVGGYSLHMYCCRQNEKHDMFEFPHEYVCELGSRCRAKARKDGWVFHNDGTATCPKCSGRSKA